MQVDGRVVNAAASNVDQYAHLPDYERRIIKRQLETPDVRVTYFTLYRFATRNDLIIISISIICAIAGGAAMPLMTVIFGNLTGTFQRFFNGNISRDEFDSELSTFTLYFVYLAIGEFITIYVTTLSSLYTGEHITQKIREKYLAAVLRQNIGFFDKVGGGEITTRITSDTNLIQAGISEKVSPTLTAISTFFSAFVIGFVRNWKLTLVLSSTVVAIVTIMGSASTFIIKFNKQSIESYAQGGTVAEEVFSSIRNAVAFGTQEKLARQYRAHLSEAQKWGIKLKAVLALMVAGMMMLIFLQLRIGILAGCPVLGQRRD